MSAGSKPQSSSKTETEETSASSRPRKAQTVDLLGLGKYPSHLHLIQGSPSTRKWKWKRGENNPRQGKHGEFEKKNFGKTHGV